MSNLRKAPKQSSYFGIIYGRPGSGKTTLLSGLKRPFFVGNEINREFDFTGFEAIKNWKDFVKNLEDLEEHQDSFDQLVVDNFSDIEGLMKADFVKPHENLSTAMGGYGAGYNELEKRARLFIERLKVIQSWGKDVILICHAKEKASEDRLTGANAISYMPDLEVKTLKPLEAYADFIFHLHRPFFENEKDKSQELGRVIFTSFSAGGQAKKKSFIDLPSEISWDLKEVDMMELISNNIKKNLGNKKETKEEKENDFDSLYEKCSELKNEKWPTKKEILKKYSKKEAVKKMKILLKQEDE